MINEYIKLANLLDKRGLKREANIIDNIIKNAGIDDEESEPFYTSPEGTVYYIDASGKITSKPYQKENIHTQQSVGNPAINNIIEEVEEHKAETGDTKPMKLLFVCAGNTCRSPMAMELAKKLWGGRIHAESAGEGIVTSDKAHVHAVEVVKSFKGDLTRHVPRDIDSINMDDYDKVIALDWSVSQGLAGIVPQEKLVTLNVRDPIDMDIGTYKRTATSIKRQLKQQEEKILHPVTLSPERQAQISQIRSLAFKYRDFSKKTTALLNVVDYAIGIIEQMLKLKREVPEELDDNINEMYRTANRISNLVRGMLYRFSINNPPNKIEEERDDFVIKVRYLLGDLGFFSAPVVKFIKENTKIKSDYITKLQSYIDALESDLENL